MKRFLAIAVFASIASFAPVTVTAGADDGPRLGLATCSAGDDLCTPDPRCMCEETQPAMAAHRGINGCGDD